MFLVRKSTDWFEAGESERTYRRLLTFDLSRTVCRVVYGYRMSFANSHVTGADRKSGFPGSKR